MADKPTGQNGMDREPLHQLQFPRVEFRRGPIIAQTHPAQAIVALDNFLQFCFIPDDKVVAARELICRAIDDQDQALWNRVLIGLTAESSRRGWMNTQYTNVLASTEREKQRAEALQQLQSMGPKPKEPGA